MPWTKRKARAKGSGRAKWQARRACHCLKDSRHEITSERVVPTADDVFCSGGFISFSLSCDTLFGTLQIQNATWHREVHEAFFRLGGAILFRLRSATVVLKG